MNQAQGFLTVCATAGTVALASVVGTGQAFAQDFVARIGHLESPQQPRHQGLEMVADLVAERTDGAVELQLFPAAQLGNAREMNEGVQLGVIEGTVSPAAFLGGFNPLVSILDVPYLLPSDRSEAAELRENAFGDAILDSFGQYGFEAIALWPNGRKNFTSNVPLDDAGSFEGQRFRVMDSNILIEQFNAVDASAIALPFSELYTALQTGVVDGQENPLDILARVAKGVSVLPAREYRVDVPQPLSDLIGRLMHPKVERRLVDPREAARAFSSLAESTWMSVG